MNFKEAEDAFKRIKAKYERGEIGFEEFKARVKELMVRDGEGNIWMIGVKSGKWYVKTPEGWKLKEPPGEETLPIQHIFEEEGEEEEKEEKFEAAVTEERVEKPTSPVSSELEAMEREYILRGFSPVSVALFLGGLGILLGVVIGAFAEALVPKLLAAAGLNFPGLGTLWKAFIYSLMTGAAFFFLFFALGFLFTLVVNLILEIFGGIKLYLS